MNGMNIKNKKTKKIFIDRLFQKVIHSLMNKIRVIKRWKNHLKIFINHKKIIKFEQLNF